MPGRKERWREVTKVAPSPFAHELYLKHAPGHATENIHLFSEKKIVLYKRSSSLYKPALYPNGIKLSDPKRLSTRNPSITETSCKT